MILALETPDDPCRRCGRDVWSFHGLVFIGGGFATATIYWRCTGCRDIHSLSHQPRADPPKSAEP
jgi:hypothetical protein